MGTTILSGTAETTNVLNSNVPLISEDMIRGVLASQFGIEGVISLLTGERDKNFRVAATDGRDYLLKVTNSAEPHEVTKFQTEALLQIEKINPVLPVPRVVPTREGASELLLDLPGQGTSVLRILTFLHGEPLHRVERSTCQRRNIAACLAELDLALKDAGGPIIPHELQWDIKYALRLRQKIGAISNPTDHRMIEKILDEFEAYVSPVLNNLRSQVIHNDFNPHNILVAEDDHTKVSGILDFGDMVHTPLVIDLAVACAYQVGRGIYPLESVCEFVSAYHAICPILPLEIEVLFDLIRARLVTTIVITSWRAARYPENKDYILRNAPPSWEALKYLSTIDRAEACKHMANACGMR